MYKRQIEKRCHRSTDSNGYQKVYFDRGECINFHSSDDCYYEEWIDDIENGWVACINFHEHVLFELNAVGIDQYFIYGGEMEELDWRTYLPHQLYQKVHSIVKERLGE